MAARSGLNRALLPLLALLLLRASAAANSLDSAVAAARTAIDSGETARAQTIIDGALAAYGKQDSESVWTLRVMRAEIFITLGKDPAAIEALRDELPPQYQHTQAAVRRLVYLGFAQWNREPFTKALALAEQHQPHLQGEVYRARASIWYSVDDARKAIHYARMYKQTSTEIKAYITLATNLTKAGLLAEATEIGERNLGGAARLPNALQNAQGNLGWAYFELGEYERAAELFVAAEATAAKIPSSIDQAAWLIQLGNVEFQKRNYSGAEHYNQRALATTTDVRNRGYAYANLARVALERSLFENARQLNERAREAKRTAKDPEALYSSDIVEARILVLKERDYARAEMLLRNVIDRSERNDLEAQTELAKLHARSKPGEAGAAFERAVATARQRRGTIKDPELRLSFFNTVADLYDAYVDFLVARDPDRALEVAETSRAESLEEGRVKTMSRRFDPKAIARANGATILSYWLGREQSYLWVITAKETKLHRLASDKKIETMVDRYQRSIRQQGPSSDGVALYEMLVAPAKIAANSRVVIVPDGRLHLLNFETLQRAPNHYWIEDVIITNATSLQILALTTPRRTPFTSASLLLVGNASSPDPLAYPLLKYAAGEMQAIGNLFPKKRVLKGADATPEGYRSASPGKFDYVHFVAHGVAGNRQPLDAFIQLARGKESYKLVARDIQKDTLDARLVTIASCEAAGTRTYAGEGVVGLAWAFLRAGADQVVASLWKVNDSATATLMTEMYAGIKAGKEPAVALRDAKRKLMKENHQTAKPFYWAPFVLYAGT